MYVGNVRRDHLIMIMLIIPNNYRSHSSTEEDNKHILITKKQKQKNIDIYTSLKPYINKCENYHWQTTLMVSLSRTTSSTACRKKRFQKSEGHSSKSLGIHSDSCTFSWLYCFPLQQSVAVYNSKKLEPGTNW